MISYNAFKERNRLKRLESAQTESNNNNVNAVVRQDSHGYAIPNSILNPPPRQQPAHNHHVVPDTHDEDAAFRKRELELQKEAAAAAAAAHSKKTTTRGTNMDREDKQQPNPMPNLESKLKRKACELAEKDSTPPPAAIKDELVEEEERADASGRDHIEEEDELDDEESVPPLPANWFNSPMAYYFLNSGNRIARLARREMFEMELSSITTTKSGEEIEEMDKEDKEAKVKDENKQEETVDAARPPLLPTSARHAGLSYAKVIDSDFILRL